MVFVLLHLLFKLLNHFLSILQVTQLLLRHQELSFEPVDLNPIVRYVRLFTRIAQLARGAEPTHYSLGRILYFFGSHHCPSTLQESRFINGCSIWWIMHSVDFRIKYVLRFVHFLVG